MDRRTAVQRLLTGAGLVACAGTTASRSWRGQVIAADRRAAAPASTANTWVLQLDWGSPVDAGRWKAHHGLDVPLVFDNVPLSPHLVGTGLDAQRLVDLLSETLIAFARSGTPDNPHFPHWPPDDLTRRATLVLDVVPRVVDAPRGAERRLFSTVPYVQPRT